MRPGYLMILLALCACDNKLPTDLSTGLTGSVVRAPVTPVCVPEVPCSAPFSAHFTVWRGSHRVASFLTDAAGRFTVYLEPGEYLLVPGADAPIMDPQAQTKTVVVGTGELTMVQLDFDTGIR